MKKDKTTIYLPRELKEWALEFCKDNETTLAEIFRNHLTYIKSLEEGDKDESTELSIRDYYTSYHNY